jgi:chromosome partitioning protein
MAKVITVTNQKGGVGKTTICAGICGAIAEMGKSVLAVDLDPQGNLSFSLGANVNDKTYTMYDVFKGKIDLYSVIQHTDNCDVAPGNILLSGCDIELTATGREYILKDQIDDIFDQYEYVLIDTPPALSVLTINAYTASNQLVIPMVPEILSLQGVSQLKETIFAVKKYFNKALEVRGIVLNKYNPRLVLTKEVEELAGIIAEQMNTDVLEQKLTNSVTVAEAPAHGKTIVSYAPHSRACDEFVSLAYEVIREERPQKTLFKRSRGRPRKYPNLAAAGN